MPVDHTISIPRQFPFHADSFRWDDFECFCARWLVSGTTLPNLTLDGHEGPSRLRVVDAHRVGVSGEKQHGIDILVTMENGATWVVQCKHMAKFGKTDASKAIEKAKREFGSYQPAHYLIWATGKVTADATLLAHQAEAVSLWNAERLTTDVVLHTPPEQCRQLIRACFGQEWGKAFFPVGDHLLLTEEELFSPWDMADRSFHHHAALAGRTEDLQKLVKFAQGGEGRKVLILSAAGGIGKSRLLREVARKTEASDPKRSVRFINRNAGQEADLPILKNIARTTIIHDDAHRMDFSRKVLAAVFQKEAEGVRLILSTRPGAEDSLRQQLMDAGFGASDIEQKELKKLSKVEMTALVTSIIGPQHEEAARALASLSDGCALVALVGAELLRSGEIKHLDLTRSDHFTAEVFTRFEGQELARISGITAGPLLDKLLRSIALLSPWPSHEPELMRKMAEFIGVQRGEIEAVCDSLQHGGLLVRTQKGLRITPDLFSDHLVYSACYEENGRASEFLNRFLNHFNEGQSAAIIQNLAEAEWRAAQKHGGTAEGILGSIWRRFIEEFENSSFWDRSQMIEKWSAFAIYQPDRTFALAGRAIDLDSAPAKEGYESLDRHDQVLRGLPSLLKPLAIWSSRHRQQALALMWRLHHIPTPNAEPSHREPFADFAEIADFASNFPDAPTGVLDWLDHLLASSEADSITNKPCGFLSVVLRPYFARHIKRNYMSDRRTFVMQTILVSVSKTRALRDRAFRLVTETIIPRGTVAAMNVLPVLAEAFSQTSSFGDLPPAFERAWRPERTKALNAIADLAKTYPHPLIHHAIRRQLHCHVAYGKEKPYRAACAAIIDAMPDTLEFRLARLTLSWSHDDSLIPYDPDKDSGWLERQKFDWLSLLQTTVWELIERERSATHLHDFLITWNATCAEHGLEPHFGELLHELARQNQELALGMLDLVFQTPETPLAGNAANLLHHNGGLPESTVSNMVHQGLVAASPDIVRSFLNVIEYSDWLQTPENLAALLAVAESEDALILRRLFEMIRYPRDRAWPEQLTLSILSRPLSPDLTIGLANAIAHAISFSQTHPAPQIIADLLDKLEAVPQLPTDHGGRSFLKTFARGYPRQMLEFFKLRIAREEALAENKQNGYASVPYSDVPVLDGLENEEDFEAIAKSLLTEFLSRQSENRHPWRQLFIMAVSRTSPLMEPLLLEVLPDVKTLEDLSDVCSLMRFPHSRIAYRHPQLIEAILTKARGFGVQAFEETQRELIHCATPQARGYSNGTLDPEYAYAIPAAGEALKHAEGHPILTGFYQKIIEIEKADAERARRMADEDLGDDWT
ncbi:MAG: restriction endonuclease [Luteolibacter sp.]